MASVNELIEMVGAETSLSTDSAQAERTQILSALNRSYRKIARDFQCVKDTIIINNTGGAVNLSLASHVPSGVSATSTSANVLGVDIVGVSDTGATYPSVFLERRPIHQVLAAQSGQDSQPSVYAMQNGVMHLNSASSVGESIHIWAHMNPSALADGGAETTITGIPPSFHEDLLGTLAISYLLEGYEGQENRGSYFRNLYRETAEDFRQFLRREGGSEMPSTRPGAPHFHSNPPLGLR